MIEEIGIINKDDIVDIKNSIIFKKWYLKFTSSKCNINKITYRGLVRNNDGNVKTVLLELDISNFDGFSFKRNILLRGEAVVVIPFFRKNGKIYYVMVMQQRVINGLESLEFPSGGIKESHSTIDNAINELREETGLIILSERLRLLESKIAACESAFDELVTWYLLELNNDEVEILTENQTVTFGVYSSGEKMMIKIIEHNDLYNIKSFQILAAISLLNRNGITSDKY